MSVVSGSPAGGRRFVLLAFPLIVGTCFLAPFASRAAAADLVGQWHLDERVDAPDEGPSSTPDSSPNDLDVSTFNGGFSGPDAGGRFGNHLPDTNVNVLASVPSGLFELSRPTVVAWVRNSTEPIAGSVLAGAEADDGEEGCNTPLYSLEMGTEPDTGLRFAVQNDVGASIFSPAAPTAIWDGQWHAVAGVFDGSRVRLYVDGAEVGTGTAFTGSPRSTVEQPAFGIDGVPTCDSNFNGDIDEVRLYDGALTPAEIAIVQDSSAVSPPDLPTGTRTLTVTAEGAGFGVVTSSPAGIDCGTDCTEDYSAGEVVTLTAEAAPGSVFVGWGGACLTAPENTCNVTMDAAKGVSVTFERSSGPPPPPQASVTAPATTTAGSPIVFDTTQTTGGDVYFWDFNNDDKFDFSSGPKEPYVAYKPADPGRYRVELVVQSPSGARDSDAVSFRVRPPLDEPLLSPVETVRSAERESTLLRRPPVDQIGFDPVPCVDQTLVFELVEAKGCMKEIIDRESIPARERAVAQTYFDLNKYFKEFFENNPESDCRRTRAPACSEEAIAQNFSVFYSRDAVMVSGMWITPVGGASLVIFPGAGQIVSSNAKMTFSGDLGSIPVPQGKALEGPLNLNVSTFKARKITAVRHSLPLFHFDARDLPSIGGFKIDGQIDLAFVKDGARRFSDLTIRVKLPAIFKAFGGGPPPSGEVSLESYNGKGVVLGRLLLQIPDVNLGGVRLSKLKFEYLHNGNPDPDQFCARKWWKVEAQIFLGPGAVDGLNMAAPPKRNGIAFCAGAFRSAGAEFTFGPPLFPVPPQVFPGVFLDSVSFSMDLGDPVLFDGSIGVSAVKILKIKGGFLFVAASPDAPYVIHRDDAGGTLKGAVGKRLVSTSFAVGGKVGVVLPGSDNTLELANGYVLYSAPLYFAAEASAKLDTFAYRIEASAGFELNAKTKRFNTYIQGEACLLGIKIAGLGACVGGLVWVSSRGSVVCAYLPRNVWEPGVGIRWSGSIEIFLGFAGDGCKPSKFWEVNVQGARQLARQVVSARAGELDLPAARRATTLAFTVKKGETTKNVHLDGAGAAPDVTVRGPDGETITSKPNLALRGKRLRVLSADRYDTTWVGVDDAKPGRYLITLQPGSPAITGMTSTRYEPNERLVASVTGKGAKRVLRYDVGRSPGQVIRFFERGRGVFRELGTARAGKGIIRFKPAVGPGGTREIVAQPTVDGFSGAARVLAKFKTRTPKAGAVKRVRVRRRGNKLVVKWNRAPNAARYTVLIRTRNGVTRTLSVKRSHRRVSFRGIPATQRGIARVVARGPLGDWGKPDGARFKATGKVKDRLLPFSQLGRGRPRG